MANSRNGGNAIRSVDHHEIARNHQDNSLCGDSVLRLSLFCGYFPILGTLARERMARWQESRGTAMVKCLWALLILSVSAEPQQVRYRQLQVGTWMVEIPSGWHYQIQSGPFLFASSKPAPPYVSRVGSFPLGNSAALYVSFRPPSERASGVTFDEWVRNKHKTRKDSFSMESQQGLPPTRS